MNILEKIMLRIAYMFIPKGFLLLDGNLFYDLKAVAEIPKDQYDANPVKFNGPNAMNLGFDMLEKGFMQISTTDTKDVVTNEPMVECTTRCFIYSPNGMQNDKEDKKDQETN